MAIVKDIDKGLKRIFKDLKEINKSFVKVGILSTAKPEKNGMNMAKLGAIHEYGAPSQNIPSRPFMRQTIDRIKEQIKKFNESELKLIMQGKSSATMSLKRLGMFVKTEIQREFTQGNFIPNSPKTIKRKGSDKPLIDTGRLRASINYEVVKK